MVNRRCQDRQYLDQNILLLSSVEATDMDVNKMAILTHIKAASGVRKVPRLINSSY